MDAAEAWLREHDPEYEQHCEGWRHCSSGSHLPPPQEVLWDEDRHGLVDHLVPVFDLVGAVGRRVCEHSSCGQLFTPSMGRQRFCGDRCKSAAEQRKRRHRRRWQV